MFVNLEFVLDEVKDVYSLSYEVLSGDRFWYVDEDGLARSIVYETVFSNDEFFTINEDISSRNFILEGQAFLEEGKAVRVLGE